MIWDVQMDYLDCLYVSENSSQEKGWLRLTFEGGFFCWGRGSQRVESEIIFGLREQSVCFQYWWACVYSTSGTGKVDTLGKWPYSSWRIKFNNNGHKLISRTSWHHITEAMLHSQPIYQSNNSQYQLAKQHFFFLFWSVVSLWLKRSAGLKVSRLEGYTVLSARRTSALLRSSSSSSIMMEGLLTLLGPSCFAGMYVPRSESAY